MSEVDDNPEAAAGDAMDALTRAMVEVFETQIAELTQQKGAGSALAFAFAGIPACAKHLALTMGAEYCIAYLDDVAKPLREFLTEHGGPGVSVRQ